MLLSDDKRLCVSCNGRADVLEQHCRRLCHEVCIQSDLTESDLLTCSGC